MTGALSTSSPKLLYRGRLVLPSVSFKKYDLRGIGVSGLGIA